MTDYFKDKSGKDVSVDFCLDLGGDSIKIAVAYGDGSGKAFYGKVDTETEGAFGDVGIPAIAYYDEVDENWLYGEEVDAAGKSSFITVVRIKDLLSLLQERCAESNAYYYHNGKFFPKFFFPARRGSLDNFEELVKRDDAFTAKDTPKTICENYYRHIRAVINSRFKDICKHIGVDVKNAYPRISFVYSPSADDTVIAELERLITFAFDAAPYKKLSSTKALSMYAYTYNYISKNDEMLVFDLGEETLSVAKAVLIKGAVTIDGEDGHNLPVKLGGMDIDEALVDYINSTIQEREVPGNPSFGEEGHIVEGGMQSKQYLLMKDLKQVKVLLSRPLNPDSVFQKGVPISIWRELCIQRRITREQFTACIGIDDCSGVAGRIVDYILSELRRPVNENVKKICLSGGIAKTYMLAFLIDKKLRENGYKMEFMSLNGKLDSDNDIDILTYEDTAYAPAVGGALVAFRNQDVKTALSMSYATFVHKQRKPQPRSPKLLKIIADRGEFLKDDGDTEFLSKDQMTLDTANGAVVDHYYSTIMTRDDISNFKYQLQPGSNRGVRYMFDLPVIGEVDSDDYKHAEEAIGLRLIVRDAIRQKYKGEYVNIVPATYLLQEGFIVDKRGRASTIIKNLTTGNLTGKVEYFRTRNDTVPYKTVNSMTIPAKDVELELKLIFEVVGK